MYALPKALRLIVTAMQAKSHKMQTKVGLKIA